MRLICLVNNYLGWQALQYLQTQDEVVAVVVHPPERAKFEQEIRASAGNALLLTSDDLRNASDLKKLADLQPDIGISVLFAYVLKSDFLKLLPRGCLNLHPAFLPYNRGMYPNVWSIVDGTPAGVTLHYIDEGIDTGDIVRQVEVPVACTDTGESLYHKLESCGLQLLRECWPDVRNGRAGRTGQRNELATFHKRADVGGIDEIRLDESYNAGHLLNILRARTFPPYGGAYFRCGGRKVYINVELKDEEEI